MNVKATTTAGAGDGVNLSRPPSFFLEIGLQKIRPAKWGHVEKPKFNTKNQFT